MKEKSIYIDIPCWKDAIDVDDFIVAIGKTKSNSVYHVATVKRIVPRMEGKVNRFHLGVVNTDLVTALKRDQDQRLIPMSWYKRKKKKS